jgi:tetratricopeptide (TPR) repeat protein
VDDVHTLINRQVKSGPGAQRQGIAVAVLSAVALMVGCSSVRPAKQEAPKGDPAALTVVAEIALERGDCKGASESYAKAAAVGAVSLARRATEVALACEHLPAAWESVTRWRTLAPTSREADAMYAVIALKLYHIPEAKVAINDFVHAPPTPPPARQKTPKVPLPGSEGQQSDEQPPADDDGDQARTGADRSDVAGFVARKAGGGDAGLIALAALLLESSDATSVLAAMSSTLESAQNDPESLSLLGDLALSAYDAQRAEHYAKQALERDPNDFAAKRVLARAYVIRGDATKAIATARESIQADPAHSTFELVEVLIALDRTEEAHQELERLRGAQVPAADIDRRLALLAFEAGDLKEAQQRFSELASSGQAAEASLLYLADIAARQGDTDGAISGYRRLYDSSVALQARSRAAALLLGRGDHKEALTLLDDYATEHPESEFDLTLAKAHLLADHGEADAGVELLTVALEKHPKHPSIEYERATILEQGGHVHDSIEALQHLLTERVDDPTLLNALGYTLADHNMELSKAESLIRRALLAMPDNPAALDSLGWVRFRQGDSKAALVTLERAYYISHDSEIAAHWGEAIWASGDHSGARKVWAAALAREPDSQQLKATLARFLPDAAK